MQTGIIYSMYKCLKKLFQKITIDYTFLKRSHKLKCSIKAQSVLKSQN